MGPDNTPTPRPVLLLVEDDPIITKTMVRLLQGYDVECCSDGASALDFLQHSLPAVIVCDLGLPDMDGWALFDLAVEHVPGLRERFIFTTGGVPPSLSPELLRTQRPVLMKPFDIERLREAAQAVVLDTGHR